MLDTLLITGLSNGKLQTFFEMPPNHSLTPATSIQITAWIWSFQGA